MRTLSPPSKITLFLSQFLNQTQKKSNRPTNSYELIFLRPFLSIMTEVSSQQQKQQQQNDHHHPPSVYEHVKEIVHQEEVGDNWRTARSGVQTKLADVRAHDHGRQSEAHKIAHHAQTVEHPQNVKEMLDAEHNIEHIHEHRTLLSGFTL